MVRAWPVLVVVICLTSYGLPRADLYFANRDEGYIFVSEDVGTIPITISSRATTDRQAFLHFDYYCKQIAS